VWCLHGHNEDGHTKHFQNVGVTHRIYILRHISTKYKILGVWNEHTGQERSIFLCDIPEGNGYSEMISSHSEHLSNDFNIAGTKECL